METDDGFKLVERDGVTYEKDETVPYNGKAVSYYKANVIWRILFNLKTNKKEVEGDFKDGKADGVWTGYYESGQKLSEESYKHGKKEGVSSYWYANGQKMMEINFKDDIGEGVSTAWWDNGHMKERGSFKNGQKDGVWTEWYWEDGQKISEETYKDGELISSK